MKTFNEFINEGITEINITTSDSGRMGDFGSPNLKPEDEKYWIGTIGYKYLGKENYYDFLELSPYDKKEFNGKNIFAISSSKMIHQTRTLVQIRNGNVMYFMNNDKYEADNSIVFDGRGVKITRIVLKNRKYSVEDVKRLIS